MDPGAAGALVGLRHLLRPPGPGRPVGHRHGVVGAVGRLAALLRSGGLLDARLADGPLVRLPVSVVPPGPAAAPVRVLWAAALLAVLAGGGGGRRPGGRPAAP